MKIIEPNFNRSIKYTFTVRDSVDGYTNKLKYLYSIINCIPIKKTNDFYKYYTAFKSDSSLRTQKDELIQKYQNYNLTRNFKISSIVKAKEDFEVVNTISFIFSNKEGMKDFLRDFRFNKDDVVYGFFIKNIIRTKTHCYGFQIAFDKGIHKNKALKLQETYNNFFAKTNRYGKAKLLLDMILPSAIHDRWVDPFTAKTIYDVKGILDYDYKTNPKQLNYQEFYNKINPYLKQFEAHFRYKNSRPQDFISNKDCFDSKILKINTYIVNHYMQHKNPYKRSQAKKDWKYAAEQFLAEVFGKAQYHLNLHNSKYNYSVLKEEFDRNSTTAKSLNDYKRLAEDHRNAIKSIEKEIELLKLDNKVIEIESLTNKLETEKCRLGWNLEDIERHQKQYDIELEHFLLSKKEEKKQNEYKAFNLQFSKAEVRSFIKSLNIKTKIDHNLFRKKMLDGLMELNFLESDFTYKPKITCRTYKLKIDFVRNMYSKIKEVLEICFNIFNLRFISIIMLKNLYLDESIKLMMKTNRRRLSGVYRGPPGL